MLIGLGIRHLGQVGLDRTGPGLPATSTAILAADEATLAEIDGVGPVIAESVVAWFASPVNRSVVDRLRAAGLHLSSPAPTPQAGRPALPQTLEGRSVVVTGTLEGYTREEAEAAVLARGGKSPGHGVEEDVRRGRRAGPGGLQGDQGRTARRAGRHRRPVRGVPGHGGAARAGLTAIGAGRRRHAGRRGSWQRLRLQGSITKIDDLLRAALDCALGCLVNGRRRRYCARYRFGRIPRAGRERRVVRSAGASGGVGSTVPISQARRRSVRLISVTVWGSRSLYPMPLPEGFRSVV